MLPTKSNQRAKLRIIRCKCLQSVRVSVSLLSLVCLFGFGLWLPRIEHFGFEVFSIGCYNAIQHLNATEMLLSVLLYVASYQQEQNMTKKIQILQMKYFRRYCRRWRMIYYLLWPNL